MSVLEHKRESIVAACTRHGVRRLEVFGSAARGEFVPGKSDLDLLVVMVDAVKNPYIVADIERTKQTLYAA